MKEFKKKIYQNNFQDLLYISLHYQGIRKNNSSEWTNILEIPNFYYGIGVEGVTQCLFSSPLVPNGQFSFPRVCDYLCMRLFITVAIWMATWFWFASFSGDNINHFNNALPSLSCSWLLFTPHLAPPPSPLHRHLKICLCFEITFSLGKQCSFVRWVFWVLYGTSLQAATSQTYPVFPRFHLLFFCNSRTEALFLSLLSL